VTKAEEIVRKEFERLYKYSTNLGDIWARDGTDSIMVIHCTIFFKYSYSQK
jgi:hypothetical protein